MGLSPGDRVEMTIVASVSGGSFGTARGRLGYIKEDEWCSGRPVLEADRPMVGESVGALVLAIDPGCEHVCEVHQILGGRRVEFAASIRALRPSSGRPPRCWGDSEIAARRGIGHLTSVDDLDLSVRSKGVLRVERVRNLAELVSRSLDDLLNNKGLGQTSIDEIRGMLADLDMHLRGESVDRVRATRHEYMNRVRDRFPVRPPDMSWPEP